MFSSLNPSSSHVSRIAVFFSVISDLSNFPPGNEISDGLVFRLFDRTSNKIKRSEFFGLKVLKRMP